MRNEVTKNQIVALTGKPQYEYSLRVDKIIRNSCFFQWCSCGPDCYSFLQKLSWRWLMGFFEGGYYG